MINIRIDTWKYHYIQLHSNNNTDTQISHLKEDILQTVKTFYKNVLLSYTRNAHDLEETSKIFKP